MRPDELLSQGIDVTKVDLTSLTAKQSRAGCPLSDLDETNAHSAFTFLSQLSRTVWRWLALADQFAVQQSEETITDVVLLRIAYASLGEVRIAKKSTKFEEAKAGFDWEWWIGSPSRGGAGGYIRYFVQAKRLRHGRYWALGHRQRSRNQLIALEEHARCNKAVPLYAFYNWAAGADPAASGHCKLDQSFELLGCTVAPLSVVRAALGAKGCPTFDSIHRDQRVLPWRCLLCCHSEPSRARLQEFCDPLSPPPIHEDLPDELKRRLAREPLPEGMDQPSQRELRPRWTIVITVPPRSPGRTGLPPEIPPLPTLKQF